MHTACNTDTVYHRMDTGLSWPWCLGDATQEGDVSNCLIMYSDEPDKDGWNNLFFMIMLVQIVLLQ